MDNFREKYMVNTNDFEIRKNQIYERHLKYYNSDFQKILFKNFEEEYSLLKLKFPNIYFEYRGRIKNVTSLKNKIIKKIEEGHTGNIYDIFARKIVVLSVYNPNTNETLTDEYTLKKACYEIREFLNNYSKNIILDQAHSKDYISSPKPSGYQALHLLRIHHYLSSKENGTFANYHSEIQIRTCKMEEEQKYGKASHFGYKSQTDTLDPYLMPTFLRINKKGKTHKLSEKEAVLKRLSEYNAMYNGLVPKDTLEK